MEKREGADDGKIRSGRVEVQNDVTGRKERLHPDAERERAAERKATPSGHADAAPEKIKERMAIPGGHPDVRPGGVTVDNSGNGGIINEARAIDSILLVDDVDNHRFTPEMLLEELQRSPIGIETIRHIRDSRVFIKIIDEPQIDFTRGDQSGNLIRLFSANIDNQRIAGQTIIHEMTHYWYGIGESQHAEAVCFAMEKMHIMGRDYLTREEWERMVQLAIDAYPNLNWEDGGYGDFSQFNFVREG